MLSWVDALKKERINAMNRTFAELDQAEEELLTCEISDSALEAAAGKETENSANYTLGGCTSLLNCPGY